ncbi:RNase adapter RapZ [Hippea maritima]|uniref:UPF0042 nucleotide-binding protein yhbJ n=1 Tax=Hippea maritima (strain ATCC 700847 / DSM 10411 / MH2) TaxID=760142 RepID=F2LUE7_HIPMA|nr:RNase adapter RapZ [Hippea maritima]AEA33473.1 UPF0042 nucleotide-binding protein yhbJ [Hippea maritima DSM 10411]
MEIVFISGLSGSGKTTALKAFEDSGYFCIDNLPLSLLKKFIDIIELSNSQINKIAGVCDIRDPNLTEEIKEIKEWLDHSKIEYKIIFFESDDKTLIKRFEQTRRSHPLSLLRKIPLSKAIKEEKEAIEPIKKIADFIIDTTQLNVNQLRRLVYEKFLKQDKRLIIQLISFGFKYGIPIESDNVFDVRFLPNPYFIDELKDTTGLDKKTYDFVMNQSQTNEFLDYLRGFLDAFIPHYIKEGKSYLTISIGCTGGKHRSVAIVEYIKEYLIKKGFEVEILHRDIEK